MGYAETADEAKLLESIRQHPPRAEVIYEALGRRITGGKIKPGEWLKQDVLAKEFGVTQNTVREALGRLVAEGLATHERHKGVRVAQLSSAEVWQIWQMRILLESWVMEMAAPRMTQEDLARMRELLPQTLIEDDPASGERVRKYNQEFHWIAIHSADMPHVERVLRQLWDASSPWALGNVLVFADATTRHEYQQRDLADHRALLAALEAGDGPTARQVMARHLEASLSWFQRSMVQTDGEGAR